MAKIILISGKAEHGKTATAHIIKERLETEGKTVTIVPFASYLKFVCREYFDWNGKKDLEGRRVLQYVGTDVVRKKDPDFWVRTVGDFIKMFEDDFDFFIIDDCRFVGEADYITDIQPMDVLKIRVIRNNFENSLTKSQRLHQSETDLDDYPHFDVYLSSDSGLFNLRQEIYNSIFANMVLNSWLFSE